MPGLKTVQHEVNFEKLLQEGDSLLEVASEISELQFELVGLNRRIVVQVNGAHRIRSLVLTLQAAGFREALVLGHDVVEPLLSRWSFLHNVSITTSAVEIIEMSTEARMWRMTVVGAVKAFADSAGLSTPEHRSLLSAYREGISSAELMYQALSLYKVIEGVWKLRAQRREAALASGAGYSDPGERLPTDLTNVGHPRERERLYPALSPYLGKKFTAVIDELRGPLRNAIAHLDFDADPLVADTFDHALFVEEALPLLQYMSRELLAQELST